MNCVRICVNLTVINSIFRLCPVHSLLPIAHCISCGVRLLRFHLPLLFGKFKKVFPSSFQLYRFFFFCSAHRILHSLASIFIYSVFFPFGKVIQNWGIITITMRRVFKPLYLHWRLSSTRESQIEDEFQTKITHNNHNQQCKHRTIVWSVVVSAPGAQMLLDDNDIWRR